MCGIKSLASLFSQYFSSTYHHICFDNCPNNPNQFCVVSDCAILTFLFFIRLLDIEIEWKKWRFSNVISVDVEPRGKCVLWRLLSSIRCKHLYAVTRVTESSWSMNSIKKRSPDLAFVYPYGRKDRYRSMNCQVRCASTSWSTHSHFGPNILCFSTILRSSETTSLCSSASPRALCEQCKYIPRSTSKRVTVFHLWCMLLVWKVSAEEDKISLIDFINFNRRAGASFDMKNNK